MNIKLNNIPKDPSKAGKYAAEQNIKLAIAWKQYIKTHQPNDINSSYLLFANSYDNRKNLYHPAPTGLERMMRASTS